jgi:hypothetical protein
MPLTRALPDSRKGFQRIWVLVATIRFLQVSLSLSLSLTLKHKSLTIFLIRMLKRPRLQQPFHLEVLPSDSMKNPRYARCEHSIHTIRTLKIILVSRILPILVHVITNLKLLKIQRTLLHPSIWHKSKPRHHRHLHRIRKDFQRHRKSKASWNPIVIYLANHINYRSRSWLIRVGSQLSVGNGKRLVVVKQVFAGIWG